MKNNYYQKNKEKLQKEACKIFLKKKKTKGEERPGKDIKILLKKKKKKSFSIHMSVIRIFLRTKNRS